MKICFPVNQSNDLDVTVHGHFGSAPMFLIVDAHSRTITSTINRDIDHRHGACRPLKALDGVEVDAVVVSGVGSGALAGLKQAGLKVYRAHPGTVAQNLDLIAGRQLEEFGDNKVCGGHHHCGAQHDDDPKFGCGF